MAISAVTPISGSALASGDSFSFTIDDTYTSLVIKVQTATALEKAYDSALGGAQAGYTISVITGGGTDTFTVSRNAGWDVDPLLIYIDEDESGTPTTTSLSYTVGFTASFSQGTQPYNPTAFGTLAVFDTGVLVSATVSQLDLHGFTITNLGNGKVKVEDSGGGTWISLSDTPGSITANWLVRGNAGGTALEFVDPATVGATTFLGLTDTPASYSGQALLYPRVNAGETALEFVAISVPASDLDGVINAGTPDNDVDIPVGDPLIFRDNGVALTPLTISKTGTASATNPAMRVTVPDVLQQAIIVDQPGTAGQSVQVFANGIYFENPDANQRFYDITTFPASKSGATAAANIRIAAGGNSGTGDGGDVSIQAGDATGGGADGLLLLGNNVAGQIRIGNANTSGFRLRDSTGSLGTLGDVLGSDGTDIIWGPPPSGDAGNTVCLGIWRYDGVGTGAPPTSGTFRSETSATKASLGSFSFHPTPLQGIGNATIYNELVTGSQFFIQKVGSPGSQGQVYFANISVSFVGGTYLFADGVSQGETGDAAYTVGDDYLVYLIPPSYPISNQNQLASASWTNTAYDNFVDSGFFAVPSAGNYLVMMSGVLEFSTTPQDIYIRLGRTESTFAAFTPLTNGEFLFQRNASNPHLELPVSITGIVTCDTAGDFPGWQGRVSTGTATLTPSGTQIIRVA